MEQAGCAGGDQPRRSRGEWLKAPFACAAPARPASSAGLSGGSGNPPWGHYDPCARSSLQARPDRRGKRGPELRHRIMRCREPPQSAERRAGRRIRPVISGDPEIDLAARRVTGAAFRTSACRRSAPLTSGGPENGQGAPAPSGRAGAALAAPVIPGRDEVESPESINTDTTMERRRSDNERLRVLDSGPGAGAPPRIDCATLHWAQLQGLRGRNPLE
jgi:hypothetical protein